MSAALLSSPSLLSAPSALPSFSRLSSARAPRLPAELRSFLALFGLTVDSLLTYGEANTKIAKGSELAFSALLHLLPDRSLARALTPDSHESPIRSELPGLRALAAELGLLEKALSVTLCPFSSDACRELCLAFSGRGGISLPVASCRARRSLAFLYNRDLFLKCLLWAAGLCYRKARKASLLFACRLNGTQELPWHTYRLLLSEEEASLFSALFGSPIAAGLASLPDRLSGLPDCAPYDYSKAPLSWLQGARSSGVHVTASLAADRQGGSRDAINAVLAGFSLAVPILLPKGAPLPSELWLSDSRGRELRLLCIDGDLNDLRMHDPLPPSGFHGVAPLLRLKRSRGSDPLAAPRFALAPSLESQALHGGGFARFAQ